MMAVTLATATEPYLIPCRHCGETVAVRMKTGKLRVLGPFLVEHGSRINITCEECKQATRVTVNLQGIDRSRP